MMCNLDLSRILSKWRVIAPAILICAVNAYADCADCEAYKTQVVNDCNALDSSLQSVANNVNSSIGFANSGYNSSTDPNDKAIFATITATLNNTQGYIDSVSSFVSSIRLTANSLQCNASSNTVGSCDCAQYLQSLISLLQSCNQTVASVKSGMDSVVSSLGSTSDSDDDIVSTLNTIRRSFEDFSFIVNAFIANDQGDLEYNISDFYALFSSTTNRLFTGLLGYQNGTSISVAQRRYPQFLYNNGVVTISGMTGDSNMSTPAINSLSIMSLLKHLLQKSYLFYNSQLSHDYTNLVAVSSIASSLNYIKDSITNKPSVDIWGYVQEVDRSPLDGVSSQYFSHLTNEYLATWSANDNPNTNWFRRVELLLASMVFRDSGHQEELDEIEEGLPSSSDLSSLENSLDASELFDVDIGGQFFDNAPSLPDFGSQLPQTLVITIPSFGGDNSQSASSAYNIEIDVNSISSICDAVRACFRFLWWGLVALLVFFLGRWFLRGCSLAFRLIQGVHFS